MKQYIRLEPLEYIPRKPKPKQQTESEKVSHIIALANKLGVKIQK